MREVLKVTTQESPQMKRTPLDVTTGSIDWRARAELDEIEELNVRNVQDPKDYDRFKSQLEKLAKPWFDSNYEATFSNSQTIKEDVDPNEKSFISQEQRERMMKGTLNLHELSMPKIPEYEGI